jgi:acetyl-CoA carboxylase alpha subunit
MDLVDGVVPEPEGGAHTDYEQAAQLLDVELFRALTELSAIPLPELLERRYQRFRRMGQFFTPNV